MRELPGLPLKLMAYIANPKGGFIHYPAHAGATLNQQDIRIVLDPALNEDIEDLDATKDAKNTKKQ